MLLAFWLRFLFLAKPVVGFNLLAETHDGLFELVTPGRSLLIGELESVRLLFLEMNRRLSPLYVDCVQNPVKSNSFGFSVSTLLSVERTLCVFVLRFKDLGL